MPLLNYTTKVNANKTVSEIQALLGSKGASQVSVDYADGKPGAIEFRLSVMGSPLAFRLPCNIEGVQKAMIRQRVPSKLRSKDHAEKVAWRIVKDWVEAQIALTESGQAEMPEVFMPYMIHASGMTAYQQMLTTVVPLLTCGEGSPA